MEENITSSNQNQDQISPCDNLIVGRRPIIESVTSSVSTRTRSKSGPIIDDNSIHQHIPGMFVRAPINESGNHENNEDNDNFNSCKANVEDRVSHNNCIVDDVQVAEIMQPVLKKRKIDQSNRTRKGIKSMTTYPSNPLHPLTTDSDGDGVRQRAHRGLLRKVRRSVHFKTKLTAKSGKDCTTNKRSRATSSSGTIRPVSTDNRQRRVLNLARTGVRLNTTATKVSLDGRLRTRTRSVRKHTHPSSTTTARSRVQNSVHSGTVSLKSAAHRSAVSPTATSSFMVEQVDEIGLSLVENIGYDENEYVNGSNEIYRLNASESMRNYDVNELRARNTEHESTNSNVDDPFTRLSRVLENTLSTVKQASYSNDNSRLINRMTTAKTLPQFDGNPLEYPRFKQALELFRDLGEYSEGEIWRALNDALKGKAREATQSLFITKNRSDDIIKTLEMRFGNPRLIWKSVTDEIKGLPSLESKRINLVEFATRLKNAVTAMKSLDNNLGYLYSPELVENLIRKLPDSMIESYVQFSSTEDAQFLPDLERISVFLHKQAERHLAAGLILDEPRDSERKREDSSVRNARPHHKSVYNTRIHEFEQRTEKNTSQECYYCGFSNHKVEFCRKFKNIPVNERVKLIKRNRLCFNCLNNGHMSDKCKKPPCRLCKRKHHNLLHFEKNEFQQKPSVSSNNDAAVSTVNSS